MKLRGLRGFRRMRLPAKIWWRIILKSRWIRLVRRLSRSWARCSIKWSNVRIKWSIWSSEWSAQWNHCRRRSQSCTRQWRASSMCRLLIWKRLSLDSLTSSKNRLKREDSQTCLGAKMSLARSIPLLTRKEGRMPGKRYRRILTWMIGPMNTSKWTKSCSKSRLVKPLISARVSMPSNKSMKWLRGVLTATILRGNSVRSMRFLNAVSEALRKNRPRPRQWAEGRLARIAIRWRRKVQPLPGKILGTKTLHRVYLRESAAKTSGNPHRCGSRQHQNRNRTLSKRKR